MSKWARIDGDRVAEITDIDPTGRFHPSIQWESVPDNTRQGMVKDGSNYHWPEPEPAAIPASVTRRQAKQALLMSALLANVQPAIDAIEDETERGMVQIFWDDSTTFERNNPQLIALGEALELTDEQIDDLFIQASEL